MKSIRCHEFVLSKTRNNIGVYLACINHFGDVQSFDVCHPQPLDNLWLDASLFCEFGGLRTAAVNHNHVDTNVMKKYNVPRD